MCGLVKYRWKCTWYEIFSRCLLPNPDKTDPASSLTKTDQCASSCIIRLVLASHCPALRLTAGSCPLQRTHTYNGIWWRSTRQHTYDTIWSPPPTHTKPRLITWLVHHILKDKHTLTSRSSGQLLTTSSAPAHPANAGRRASRFLLAFITNKLQTHTAWRGVLKIPRL